MLKIRKLFRLLYNTTPICQTSYGIVNTYLDLLKLSDSPAITALYVLTLKRPINTKHTFIKTKFHTVFVIQVQLIKM